MTDRPLRGETPFRINLEQQKKRARELQRAAAAGDPAARARFAARHPRAAEAADAPALSDAQLVVARELGLPSWPRLKAHVLAMERERAAMAAPAATLDGDRRTLHLRCGSDLREALRAAGFAGDFLEYADPLCQGPLVDEPDPIPRRAAFIVESYRGNGGLTLEEVQGKLRREAAGLDRAGRDYERVVLWFEHDSYDQLVLARCLAHFARAGAPPVLELASVGQFPGAARFIGLGQLPPEALRLLWARRRPVSPAQLDQGARV